MDFARQLAERAQADKPQKKFRSAAAPKGAKLADGYIDRTQNRIDEGEDEKAARVKALEEMMKLQQIDEATFIKLRDEILGGDVSSTHLVKGLDYKLLERIKKGEDVLAGKANEAEEAEDEELDDEFDKLEDQDVVAITKEKAAKKGEMAPPSLIPGRKRNRDQILAEMKAARQAAKEAAQPSLGAKFKKVGASKAASRIEIDGKGREVLITTDEEGNEKRKVRKVTVELEKDHGLLMPDKDVKPLGMAVPDVSEVPEVEEEDVDIFEDAGDDYDPLAGLGEDEDEDGSDEEGQVGDTPKFEKAPETLIGDSTEGAGDMAPPPRPKPSAARNYFGESQPGPDIDASKPKAFSDPTILAALKKASTLNPLAKVAESAEEAAKEARRKKMLAQDDRDAEDMDMGFGSSRGADEEDFDERKVKLSEWGNDEDDEEEKGGKTKRKRGPKKRKGDSNSAADVMRVLEQRKAAGS